MTDREKPNAGHYLEAVDRAHTICLMVSELLAEHPAVLAHEDACKALAGLEAAAMQMYQVAGRRL